MIPVEGGNQHLIMSGRSFVALGEALLQGSDDLTDFQVGHWQEATSAQ